jgi:parallel beta-helix repeat protein
MLSKMNRYGLLIFLWVVLLNYVPGWSMAVISATVIVSQDGTGDFNGSTGDVIQSAVDSSGKCGGGIVLIKQGTYTCLNPIQLPSNIWLKGIGHATILELSTVDQVAVILNQHPDTDMDKDITITDLSIEPGKGTVASAGIMLSHVERTRISNVVVQDLHRSGIDLRYASQSNIRDCIVRTGGIVLTYASHDNIVTGNTVLDVMEPQLDGHGILVSGGAGPGYRNIISNNQISNVRGIGISIDGGSHHCIVTDNSVEKTTMDAINLEAWVGKDAPHDCMISNNIVRQGRIAIAGLPGLQVIRATCTGNVIESPHADGLYLTNAEGCTLTGNVIDGAEWSGLCLGDATNNIVSNNIIRNCHSYGIKILHSTDNLISANRCYDSQTTKTQTYPIAEVGDSNRNIIINNYILGNKNDTIIVQGKETKTMNNIPLK